MQSSVACPDPVTVVLQRPGGPDWSTTPAKPDGRWGTGGLDSASVEGGHALLRKGGTVFGRSDGLKVYGHGVERSAAILVIVVNVVLSLPVHQRETPDLLVQHHVHWHHVVHCRPRLKDGSSAEVSYDRFTTFVTFTKGRSWRSLRSTDLKNHDRM